VSISKFISHSEEETRSFAANFARGLKGNEKICLMGPLGAGKTTYVRGFVSAFGIDSRRVQSPTFTLVREYGAEKKIFHVDLYRLEKENDIFEAGIHELLGTDELILVEWADRLQRYYPEDCIVVRFSHASGNERVIETEKA